MSAWRRLGMAVLLLIGAASTADAQNSCTISSTSVAFPNYSVFNTSTTDSTGTVTYRCLLPTAITIDLNKGNSATFSPRTMLNGANSLNYNLYLDSARTTIWGDGSSGTSRYSATAPTNTDVVVTVYGRIPARLDVSAGSYSDTITATITY